MTGYLTSKQVKDALKISDSTLRRWVRNGNLTPYQLVKRGKIFFKEEEIFTNKPK
jgi:predicted site-specific integrase-resolvase